MLYCRKAAIAGVLLFMEWEHCGWWGFARIVVWKTHSGEFWIKSDLQELSGLKENLIDNWAC